MSETTVEQSTAPKAGRVRRQASRKSPVTLTQHVIEVISDSGEGAQRCGQALGAIAARMGNGVWTDEIIPAEIRPPARSVAGASGNRIRLGSREVTNGGDETDFVVAFNEQVLLGRVRGGELKPGCIILLESMWRTDTDPAIADAYADTYDKLVAQGYKVVEVPMERECRTLVADARRGKNMFALGMLCNIYGLDLQLAREQIALTFGKKATSVITSNVKLLDAGYDVGGSEPGFQVPHAGRPRERAADRRQRQHRAGARRAGLGHGNLRDVSDHAGDLGLALSVRRVREGRRHRAPGRGRDRRVRLRHRRVVRRQVHGHDHVRSRLFAQAGSDRARGDGGDSAGRRQRPARRPEHRPADQGGAGRSVVRDVRQPRRCAQGGDGGQHDRGLLLLDHHGAQDRRDVQHGGGRALRRQPRDVADAVPAARVHRSLGRAADRPEPDSRGREALRLGSRDRPRAPLHSGPARRHAHA